MRNNRTIGILMLVMSATAQAYDSVFDDPRVRQADTELRLKQLEQEQDRMKRNEIVNEIRYQDQRFQDGMNRINSNGYIRRHYPLTY